MWLAAQLLTFNYTASKTAQAKAGKKPPCYASVMRSGKQYFKFALEQEKIICSLLEGERKARKRAFQYA